MKGKWKLRLQLFADEQVQASAQEDAGASKSTEVVKPSGGTEKAADGADTQSDGEEKKYTDKDLDEIINKRFARWQAQQEKKVSEVKKLAEMDAQQRAEYERDQYKKELDELKKQATLSEMSREARKILSGDGITIPDELLTLMVTTDATETKEAIGSFAKLFHEAVEAAVKDRLKGEPPRKGAGAPAKMTKEDILNIKDPQLRQQKMLENRELFNF